MDVVFGTGPLARSLASALGRFGTVLMVGSELVQGPFFWRRGDIQTGEGVHAALTAARRAFLVLDRPTDLRAFFTVLKPQSVARGVAVLPLSQDEPTELKHHPDWSVVKVAPAWGPQQPLIAAWARQLAAGKRVWLSDPGEITPIAIDDAVAAVRAAAGFRGLRWTVAGEEAATLPDLAATLAHRLDVPCKTLSVPLGWACRRANVPVDDVRAWVDAPAASWHTPGWTPPDQQGAGAWLGDPATWLS